MAAEPGSGTQISLTGVLAAIIDALKANPSCLAAIALAGIFAWLTYSSLREQEEHQHERMMALMDRCNIVNYPNPGGPGVK